MEYLDRLNTRLTEEDLHGDLNQQIVSKVYEKIVRGGSALKPHLETGEIKFSDIIRCIKNKRCLRTQDRDFGSTYLEQIIGTAIRELLPPDRINHARSLFGLHKLPPSELAKKKQEAAQPSI